MGTEKGSGVALCWSGGEDSALAPWTPRRAGSEPAALITTITERYDRISMHGVRRSALHKLGSMRCVAIGNGNNDASILEEAALGIAVIGPEGASAAALAAADLTCTSVLDALDLLTEPRVLAATLHS